MCLFIFLKAYNSEIYSWFNQHSLRYRLSLNHSIYRSSHPDVFCNKGVLKNFRKFKEKNLCWSLYFTNIAVFFNKVVWCLQFYLKRVFNTKTHFYWTPAVATFELCFNCNELNLVCYKHFVKIWTSFWTLWNIYDSFFVKIVLFR